MNIGTQENNELIEFNERLKNEVRMSDESYQRDLFDKFMLILNESGDPDNYDEYVYFENDSKSNERFSCQDDMEKL